MALWDSPRQREAYDWFTAELANLAHRVSVGRRPGASGCRRHHRHSMRGFSAFGLEQYEPIAWAEELIEPARAVDHPRLAFLM